MISYFYKYPIESIAVFVTLFPISAMLFRMDYKHTTLKYLFWCLIFKFIIESLMLYMAIHKQNNLFLYNAYVCVSYAFFARMFYSAFDLNVYKKVVIWCSLLFYCVLIYDWVYVGLEQSLMVSGTFQCLMIILFVIMFFLEITASLKIRNLLRYSLFWVCSGLLVYYCSLTFVSPLFNMLDRWDGPRDFEILLMLPAVFECFYLMTIFFGILVSD